MPDLPDLVREPEPQAPGLGRVYQQDLRSLNFLVRAAPELTVPKPPRSYTWGISVWLDQGQEGACVGFGYSHDLAARPAPVAGLSDAFARNLYHQVQMADPWPGGAYPNASPFYEGTSVLTGAKICTDLGFYAGYTWGIKARDVADGIAYTGPAIMGLTWYEGMFDTDAEGFIRPTGNVSGGHCILAHGVSLKYKKSSPVGWFKRRTWEDVDYEKSYIKLHNSWGRSWGINGECKITLKDLEFLMTQDGEACFPRRTLKKAV